MHALITIITGLLVFQVNAVTAEETPACHYSISLEDIRYGFNSSEADLSVSRDCLDGLPKLADYNINLAPGFDSRDYASDREGIQFRLNDLFRFANGDPADMYFTWSVQENDKGYLTTAQSPDKNGRHLLWRGNLSLAGFVALSRQPADILTWKRAGKSDGRMQVVFLDRDFSLPLSDWLDWMQTMTRAASEFYGGYQFDKSLIIVQKASRFSGDFFGRVRGGGGPTMMLVLRENADKDWLWKRDWVLMHELMHLGHPFFIDGRSWVMEGLATYFEPLIRARNGWRSQESVYREWGRGMPRGLAGIQQGIDRVGNPYWGGALFFLLLDRHIRDRSDGKHGFEDCLKQWHHEYGDNSRSAMLDDMTGRCPDIIPADEFNRLVQQYAKDGVPDFDIHAFFASIGLRAGDKGELLIDTGTSPARLRQSLFGRTANTE